MNVLLISLNHRTTPLAIREQLFLNDTQVVALLANCISQLDLIREMVIISTCNRVEFYCVAEDSARTSHLLLEHLRTWYKTDVELLQAHAMILHNHEAIIHLMRVASGLDSMILGEPQILSQVNTALSLAQSVSASGAILHRIFTDALHAGKRARTETAINEQTTSVSHVAAIKVAETLADKTNPHVLVIGAGEMARISIQALMARGITQLHLINRTQERTQALADEFGISAIEWHKLWDELEIADAVITATGAPHTILHAIDIQEVMERRNGRELLLVDVAVPRNIKAEIRHIAGTQVYDIDDLQEVVDANLAQRQACVPQVLAIVDEELEKCTKRLASRKVVPVIRDLRHKIRTVVDEELGDALGRLDHLSDSDKAVLQRFAHRIVNKVLHDPTTSLREHAVQSDLENYSQMVRELFALDNLQETEVAHYE